jgi:hypothetical protein
MTRVVTCCALGNLQGVDSFKQERNSDLKKIYIDSHRIKAIRKGIIVTHGAHAFLVKAVRSDERGLFF